MRLRAHHRRAILACACALLASSAAGLATSAAGLAAPAFRAVITGQRLDYAKRTARFSFKAAGASAVRFRCALRTGAGKSPFTACRSPITYRHLAQTTYTFTVYAEKASGVLSMAATRTFTIRSTLSGTIHGRTSQTTPKFAAGVKIAFRNGQVQPASSISWAAKCTGQVSSFTDLTHFNGSLQNGHFSDQHRQLQQLQGDTEDTSYSIQFTVHGKRATGTFTATTQILQGSSVIAHCASGTVSFAARP